MSSASRGRERPDDIHVLLIYMYCLFSRVVWGVLVSSAEPMLQAKSTRSLPERCLHSGNMPNK